MKELKVKLFPGAFPLLNDRFLNELAKADIAVLRLICREASNSRPAEHVNDSGALVATATYVGEDGILEFCFRKRMSAAKTILRFWYNSLLIARRKSKRDKESMTSFQLSISAPRRS